MSQYNINVGKKGTTVFISVAPGKMTETPWVLGFPMSQLHEVIEKLEQLKKEQSR